jgi:hypothetical protein
MRDIISILIFEKWILKRNIDFGKIKEYYFMGVFKK